MAEVRITIFQRMLEKQLFPDNAFYKKSINAGQPNAASIEIPQSTGNSEPVLGGVNADYYNDANNEDNATALTPVVRINTKKTYSNTIIRPPAPYVFETLQDAELSYNKAAQIAEEQADNMNTGIANYIATQWAPTLAANIIATTGLPNPKGTVVTEQQRTSAVVAGGYVGLVKRFEYADLIPVQLAIKKQNITRGQWYALITPEQWDDIRRIENVVDFEKTGMVTMLKSGVIGQWGQIKFLDPRQNDRWGANILYDLTGAAVPLAYGGALNVNCLSAMLFFNDKYVERNEGAIKFFSRKNDPIYMGDIAQWGVRAGGTFRRLDSKGVIAVYEAQTT